MILLINVNDCRATYILEGKNQNRKDEIILEEEEDSDAGSSKPIIKIGSIISSIISSDSSEHLPPIPNGDATIVNVDAWLEGNQEISSNADDQMKIGNVSQKTNKILPFPLRFYIRHCLSIL